MDNTSAPSTADEYEIIRNLPALAPPSGVIPNFDNPPNNNKLAMSIIVTSLSFAIIFTVIRLYTRIFCVRIRLEDCLCFLSVPFFVAGTWILTHNIPRSPGFLVHQWDLRVKDVEEFIYDYVIVTILYCVCSMLIKTSILLEWIHLFVPTSRTPFFWICTIMMWINFGLYIATIITLSFSCVPQEKIWRRYIPGTCIDTERFNISTSTLHLAFNLTMLCIPHRVIWRLSLTTQRKIGVSLIFSVGLIACACALGRVVSSLLLQYSSDTTDAYSRHLIWSVTETAAAKLIFCVPAVPTLFRSPVLLNKLPSYLRSKLTARFASEDFSRVNNRHSMHRISNYQPSVYEHPWVDEEVHLRELDLVRTWNGRENTLSPEHFYGGILRTTEIAITTTEDSNSKNMRTAVEASV